MSASTDPPDIHENLRRETIDVDISQILKYVSRRELERFGNSEFEEEKDAEAIVRKNEATTLAKKILEKNARAPDISRGLSITSDVPLRTKGRPRSRWRGGGRPRGRGRGQTSWQDEQAGLLVTEDTEVVNGLDENGLLEDNIQTSLQEEELSLNISDIEDSGESGDLIPRKQPSPDLLRSSFIANSALPTSPVAAYRSSLNPLRLHKIHGDEVAESEDGEESVSMNMLGLKLGVGYHEAQDYSRESELSYSVKKRKTESMASALMKTPQKVFESDSGASIGSFQEDTMRLTQSGRNCDEMDVDDGLVGTNGYTPDEDKGGVHSDSNEATDEYVVEAILDHAYDNGKKYYLIKWEGYEDSSDWLTEEDLAGASEMVADYNARLAKKKRKR